MFGYLITNAGALDKAEKERYRSFYCGLCDSLMAHGGLAGRKTLSYDLTFIEMLLHSLYNDDERSFKKNCPLHPLSGRKMIQTRFNDYCADMNLLLSYYKMLDDYNDSHQNRYLKKMQPLQPVIDDISRRYPRQCGVVKEQLNLISAIEKNNILNPDPGMHHFGLIMAEILVKQNDEHSDLLRKFGYHLGRFIYLMDAVVDLKEDLKSQNYNPLVASDPNDFESMLMMVMEECDCFYRQLSLHQDRAILDNIFYNGIWSRYQLTRKRKANVT